MEAITGAIYGGATYANVNKLRYELFLQKYHSHTNTPNISNGIDMSLLPPCCSAPDMHIRRVNYQVFVWIHSHENKPGPPDLDKSGWKINGEEIEYDWVKGNLIVPEQVINILCEQNFEGDADQDRDDDDDDDQGVDITNMVDKVFADESDED